MLCNLSQLAITLVHLVIMIIGIIARVATLKIVVSLNIYKPILMKVKLVNV